MALSGALDLLRRREDDRPAPPLNLLGDYGGGGMLLVVGILSALFERSRSGLGQVVDAAMVDGVALLTTIFHGMIAEGLWPEVPGSHVLQLGAPFYNVYETADGKYVTVGAGEPQFYANLVELVDAGDELASQQSDPTTWADGTARLAAVFKSKTRDEWCALLDGTDTCFAPVLTVDEAPRHPQLVARGTYVEVDGVVQPSSAPRFSRTPSPAVGPLAATGQHTSEVLLDWGLHPGGDRRTVRAGRGRAGRRVNEEHTVDATVGIPPGVTEETAEFWEAAKDGRLLVEHCASCGADQFPPRGMCRSCRARDTTMVEITSRGRVYSYTVNYQRWMPDLEVPYADRARRVPRPPGLPRRGSPARMPARRRSHRDGGRGGFRAGSRGLRHPELRRGGRRWALTASNGAR